jgi:uncharacterized protein YdeI (YjbR/CyaY-like superfamily)
MADVDHTEEVDEFMGKLNHPFKAEVQAVRDIIMNVNRGISEQIEGNAPSFSYKGYFATFNLHAREHVQLIFHNGAILHDKKGIFEGNYPHRRMVYFCNMKDVKTKRPALEKVVKEWVRLMNGKAAS